MGPFTDLERYRFDLHGFVVRRAALRDNDVARLNSAIDRLRLPPARDSIGSQRFTGLLEAGGLLRDLMDHDAVIDVVRELCGAHARLDHAYGIVMSPGTSGLGLHGGGHPFDPAQYYEVRGGHIHTGLIAVQWALVDHLPGQGGFACIPGSHTSRFPMPSEIGLDHELVLEVPLRAGDMVVFTEALTHGTLPWRGATDRRTLLYKYSPGSSAWDRRPACEESVLASLTDRQRALCQPPSVFGKSAI
ncbi:MAG: phytanoyl-CoA dioxygenase family protein [Acidimicrobiia bacterium]